MFPREICIFQNVNNLNLKEGSNTSQSPGPQGRSMAKSRICDIQSQHFLGRTHLGMKCKLFAPKDLNYRFKLHHFGENGRYACRVAGDICKWRGIIAVYLHIFGPNLLAG